MTPSLHPRSLFDFYKKEISLLLLILTGLTQQSLFAQCNTLVWADEFDSTALNTNNWVYVTGNGCGGVSGCGYGNGELEYYTNRTKNVNVTGGNLVLTAVHETNYLGSGSNYTSGKVYSKGKLSWKYGRFEARIKAPSASAIWPAFWMLPDKENWPKTGEIDILETQNKNPKNASQTLHFYCSPCGNHQYVYNNYNTGTDWSANYHIYAIDWTPQQIKFSIDGVTTVTYTPASFGAKGGLVSDWPFDNDYFYLILNLAIGGSYTGNATPVTGDYPVSMLVDYIRVYTNPQSLALSGPALSFTGETHTYSASDAGAGATYAWTVPTGAAIVSGAGTKTISVQYNNSLTGDISCAITPSGCSATNVTLTVKAIDKSCSIIMDDFESNRNISGNTSDGTLSAPVSNPGKGGSNSSNSCASYARNSAVQYDILGYTNFLIGDPDDFRKGLRKFTMDVRTSAPQGTSITIEFDKTDDLSKGWPFGRHSQYTATTGPANTWTKLTFTWTASPDGALKGSDVDKIQILFNPNSTTNKTYYFDNLISEAAPTTSAITGNTTVCYNKKGVKYSVTGLTGSTYNWTNPNGTTIASGQGSNTIYMNFDSIGGNLSVIETSTLLCAGAAKTTAITAAAQNCNVGVDVLNSNADFSSFPNPFSDETVLRFNHPEKGNVSLKIMNLNGALVLQQDGKTNEDILIGKDFAQGIYIVQAQYLDQIKTIRIVKVE